MSAKKMMVLLMLVMSPAVVYSQGRRGWKELRNNRNNMVQLWEPIPMWNNFRELQPIGDWRTIYRSPAASDQCLSECSREENGDSNACYRGERSRTRRRREYTTFFGATYADQRRWDNFVHPNEEGDRWINECGTGPGGPTQWGESPIQINPFETVQLEEGQVDLQVHGFDIRRTRPFVSNTGHSIQVTICGQNVDDCDAVVTASDWPCKVHGANCGNDTYTLHQFHFHFGEDETKGSEHQMCGSPRMAEMHMVLLNKRWVAEENPVPWDLDNPERGTRLMVLGSMIMAYEDAPANEWFQPILDAVYFPEPRQSGQGKKRDFRDQGLAYFANTSGPSQGPIYLDKLLPAEWNTKYYTYAGGLTTPPCSQIATWFIFENAVVWSMDQLKQLRKATTFYHFSHVHHHGYTAILYLCVMLIIGTLTKQMLVRYAPTIPYPMVVMLWGAVINWFASIENDGQLNPMQMSIRMWSNIDGHIVLYVWLPILLFGDVIKLNFHTMVQTFWQACMLAGPGVLLSTILTGLVVQYLYLDWSWSFSLAIGSLLSATDPIAVLTLMKELGAPKGLTYQISGESLFNDGTSVILFTVFFDMSRHRRGQYASVARLIRIITRMIFFSPCLGILVGAIAVYWMKKASRRHSKTDALVQLSVLLVAAYLGFFLSDNSKIGQASGILTTVACAAVISFRAWPFIVSREAIENVWATAEHVLITMIFSVVGILMSRAKLSQNVNGRDVLNCIILYLAVFAIRAVVVFVCRPFMNCMGPHKVTNKESVFLIWGGLRGVIAIALVLFVKSVQSGSNRTWPHDRDQQAEQITFLVGGVVFLTLLVNAPTARPMLKCFGLVYGTAADKYKLQIVDHVMMRIVRAAEDAYEATCLKLKHDAVDIIRHCSLLERLNDSSRATPNQLALTDGALKANAKTEQPVMVIAGAIDDAVPVGFSIDMIQEHQSKANSVEDLEKLPALREVFLRVVQAQYWAMIKCGELPRKAYESLILIQSIDKAQDKLEEQLDDLSIVRDGLARAYGHSAGPVESCLTCVDSCTPAWFTSTSEFAYKIYFESSEASYIVMRAFVHAHGRAQRIFAEAMFGSTTEMNRAEELIILAESANQVNEALELCADSSDNLRSIVKSKLVGEAVLESAREALYKCTEDGLLSEEDAKPVTAKLDADEHALRLARKDLSMQIARAASQEDRAISLRSKKLSSNSLRNFQDVEPHANGSEFGDNYSITFEEEEKGEP
uniref:Alpha-carbonic anhydrase domain-containing protein n=1 Tax=Aureoumbra lagunensis TaxID=44058 RepID=A0A7S3K0K8_9STRA